MKDIKLMSNSELSSREVELKSEYEVVKNKIMELYEKLFDMDDEYNKIQVEKSRRNTEWM